MTKIINFRGKIGLPGNNTVNTIAIASSDISLLAHAFEVAGLDNPATDPNCILWLDASDASTFTLTGALVDEWRDKTSNNNDYIGAGITRPDLLASQLNGLPGVSFGAGEALTGPTVTALRGGSAGEYQILAVFSPAGTDPDRIWSTQEPGAHFLEAGSSWRTSINGIALPADTLDAGYPTPRIVSASWSSTLVRIRLGTTGSHVSNTSFGSGGVTTSSLIGPGSASGLGVLLELRAWKTFDITRTDEQAAFLATKWGL